MTNLHARALELHGQAYEPVIIARMLSQEFADVFKAREIPALITAAREAALREGKSTVRTQA